MRAAGRSGRSRNPRRWRGVRAAHKLAAVTEVRRINLALQGGGAHGAFTWGVLDRLLEDERILIDGISGTSAGAMNGAVMAEGLIEGGREGARQALDHFWRRMSSYGAFSPLQLTPWDRVSGNWNLDNSPGYLWLDALFRMMSPYQFNPANINPLRELLVETIDIAKVRACDTMKLFVCATNVRTGKIRIFDNSDVTIDALLASACLPMLFHSVIIDGDAYWDGGYMGNPAIFPLIYSCESRDIVIVEVNPLTREGVPRTATEIVNRVNEISFNSSLMREMRAIAFVTKLIEDETVDGSAVGKLKKMLIHRISPGATVEKLGVASKYNPDLEFLHTLKRLGRAQTEAWLAENFDALGERSSIDIREVFL
jgi:NTE family protein